VMSFAHYPPAEGNFLTSALWDKLMAGGWREKAKRPERPRLEERDRELFAYLREMADAPRAEEDDVEMESADAIMFERKVPVRRGKWRLVPSEAEEGGGDRAR